MNGVFAYDGPIFIDRDGVYCDAVITDEVLSRYLEYVNHLYVLIRVSSIDTTYKEAHFLPILSKNVTIVAIPNIISVRGFFNRGQARNVIKGIVEKCDMFFLRIPGLICNEVASHCRALNKPYLTEVGGDSFDAFWNHGFTGKLIAPYMFFKQKHVVRHADYATYVTDEWLQNRYPTKGINRPASNVYLDTFDDSVIIAREKKYAREHVWKLGTLASVDLVSKGQDLVIKAMGRLKKEGIVLQYELVGTGKPDFLLDLAKKCGVLEQVVIVGPKRHDEVWGWLDDVDVYIQPSRQEGLPRSVIESLNRGCLCLGSRVAGIPELLDEDFLFDVNDVDGICKCIKRLVNMKDYKTIVVRNYEKSKKYSLDKLNTNRRFVFDKYNNYVVNNIKK